MTLRPCLQCGEPSPTTRCPACSSAEDVRTDQRRGTPSARGYDWRWAKLSARARRLQPWCTACGATQDLTCDHLVALAAGGRRSGLTLLDVQVLCRRCNAKRGAALPTYEQAKLEVSR
jgi:5-methylcytosine-specific restriction endonuclease McrA